MSDRTLREAEIQLRRFHCRLGRLHSGFGLRLLLDFVVQLAPRNRARFGQWRVAVHVDRRERQLCLGLPELPFGLVQCRLKRTRIDLEQNLALFDLRAFAVILADQISVGLRLDLRVDDSRRAFPPTRRSPAHRFARPSQP